MSTMNSGCGGAAVAVAQNGNKPNDGSGTPARWQKVVVMGRAIDLVVPAIPAGYEFVKFATPKPGQLYIPHNDPARNVPSFEVKKCEKDFYKASVETTRAIVREVKSWTNIPAGLQPGEYRYRKVGKSFSRIGANGQVEAEFTVDQYKAIFGANASLPSAAGVWKVEAAKAAYVRA